MTNLRKKLQAKLRRKYKYSTMPCGTGTILEKQATGMHGVKKDAHLRFDMGFAKGENVGIMIEYEPNKWTYSYITFDELELLHSVAQELKKEWVK